MDCDADETVRPMAHERRIAVIVSRVWPDDAVVSLGVDSLPHERLSFPGLQRIGKSGAVSTLPVGLAHIPRNVRLTASFNRTKTR